MPDDLSDDPESTPHMTHELCIAIYRYLAKSPCKLLLVSMDDIIGRLDQQNLPGTVDSYPNWMQKSPYPLEDKMLARRFSVLSSLFE